MCLIRRQVQEEAGTCSAQQGCPGWFFDLVGPFHCPNVCGCAKTWNRNFVPRVDKPGVSHCLWQRETGTAASVVHEFGSCNWCVVMPWKAQSKGSQVLEVVLVLNLPFKSVLVLPPLKYLVALRSSCWPHPSSLGRPECFQPRVTIPHSHANGREAGSPPTVPGSCPRFLPAWGFNEPSCF